METLGYRLVVGEVGNEQGHIVPCKAQTEAGVMRAAKRAVAGYRGDGWCMIQAQTESGDYMRIATIGRTRY